MLHRRGASRFRPETHKRPSGQTSIAHTCTTRHASDGRFRGGDVFAHHVFADGSLAVMIGDAASKGPLGVLHSEMLRAVFLRSVQAGLGPGAVVDQLNTIRFNVPACTDTAFFASVVVAVIDSTKNLLTYASAGHEVALLFSGRAHAHLAPTGPVIGLFPECRFPEKTSTFGHGDMLVLGTDGVSEARSLVKPNAQFGTYGIVRAIAQNGDDSAGAAVAAMSACDAFCGHYFRDDATLAVIYRLTM